MPVGQGSTSWLYQQLKDAQIDPAAAIAYSKLNLASSIQSSDIVDGTIVNADINASAAIALSKLADPGSGNVVTSTGSGAIAAKPPGYEINYTQITSSFTITATTEATSTTAIAPGAITFDGGPVVVEFYCPLVTMPAVANAFVVVSLWESTTELGQLWQASTPSSSILELTAFGKYRFTPSAGSHTYTVKAYATSTTGTPQLVAGNGGTALPLPAFVRFTKV